jgi:hypothetical protein
VRYDAQEGKWFTIGKGGESRIKDPVRQASGSSHALGRALARSARGGGEAISFGHAVAFPDCRVARKALRPDLPRELVLDHGDVSGFPERIDGLFRHWFDADTKAPLGAEGIGLPERVLANSFELRAPLAFELAEEDRELHRLTEQQHQVLDMLSRQTRVAIAGCAGSGKTFLAAEKARRLAAQGFPSSSSFSTSSSATTCGEGSRTSRASPSASSTGSAGRSRSPPASTSPRSPSRGRKASTTRRSRPHPPSTPT